jgi:hypothetical protein
MGKRELLLILAFATVGAMVYYATAPPSAPGEQGFSISRMLDTVRRELHGNRSSAELTTTTAVPLSPGVTEVRFETRNAPLKISGEDRADVLCELQVWSSGYDETEAKRYAGETLLKATEAGVSLVLAIKYPDPATQRATLVVRMPKALAVRIQPSRSTLAISDVAAVDLAEWRGEAVVRRISGRVTAIHRGGTLTVEGAGALKLNTRGSTVVVKDVKAEAVMQVQAGELRGQSLGGPVEVELNGTRLMLEDLTTTRRPIRINATGGSVTLGGVRTDTRIDGRDSRIDVALDQPAPVAIYSEGEEPMQVTLPTAGFQVDALATDARVTVPDGLLEVKTTDNEQRTSGAIGGGGPTITLRSSHGNITIKTKEK